MKVIYKSVVVLLFAGLVTGCASSGSMHMVARRNSPDAPTSTDGIVLAKHPQPRPEEQRLNRVLTEVLKLDAPDAKSAVKADYVLAYWIEESWDEVIPVDKAVRHENSERIVIGDRHDPTGGRMAGESFNSLKDESQPDPHYIPTKGVKLLLYSNRAQGAARLTPVWEGYIEVSSTESSPHLKAAVQSLLAQFGKDFTGRVRLQK